MGGRGGGIPTLRFLLSGCVIFVGHLQRPKSCIFQKYYLFIVIFSYFLENCLFLDSYHVVV